MRLRCFRNLACVLAEYDDTSSRDSILDHLLYQIFLSEVPHFIGRKMAKAVSNRLGRNFKQQHLKSGMWPGNSAASWYFVIFISGVDFNRTSWSLFCKSLENSARYIFVCKSTMILVSFNQLLPRQDGYV